MIVKRLNINGLQGYLEDGDTVLVPNLRSRDAILFQYLNDSGQTPKPTPKIFPIDIFIKKLWDLNSRTGTSYCSRFRIISPEEELVLWETIIEVSLKSIPLLNIGKTSKAVSHSYHMAKQWILNETELEKSSSNFTKKDAVIFSNWRQKFQEHCNEKGIITLVDSTISLIKLISSKKIKHLPERTVLVNFNESPPLYKKLFDVLPKTVDVSTFEVINSIEEEKQTLIETKDINHEVALCANWINGISQKFPHAHIGILAPDKDLYKEKFEKALANEIRADNLYEDLSIRPLVNSASTGLTLFDYALIYDAFLILKLCKAEHYINDIVRLLQSPFVVFKEDKNDSIRQERMALCSSLRKLSKSTINNQEFLNFLANEKTNFSSEIFSLKLINFRTRLRNMRGKNSIIIWTELFEELLNYGGWPNKNSEQKLPIRTLNEWDKLLQKFRYCSDILPKLDFESALGILEKLAKSIQQKSNFNGALPLSFFSINEAVSLNYDYVWLLGMNDSNFPKPANPSPFIQYSLQESLGMPFSNSETELRTARTHLKHIIGSTKFKLIASFHRSDDKQRYEPSRILEEFNFSNSEGSQSTLIENPRQRSSIEFENIFNESLAISKTESISGGSELLSDQSRCPFKSFAINRLGAKPDSAPAIGISKMTKGTALHIALEYLFTEIPSRDVLLSLSKLDLESLIKKAAQRSINHLLSKNTDIATPKICKVEFKRITKLLVNFMNEEKNQQPFEIISLEKKLSATFGNVTFNIRIDRIDKTSTNNLVLIDYKSGKYTPSPCDWIKERPSDMQLPLYYSICNSNEVKSISAVLIASINSETQSAYSGVSSKESIKAGVKAVKSAKLGVASWDELTKLWDEKVYALATDINNGECDVNPINESETCKTCGLQALCRKHELLSLYKDT